MDVFIELSLIIVIATGMAGFMKLLKQPLIMGHILTGVLVGPRILGITGNSETIEIFSQFGISILLFIVGLSLSPKIVREVGKVSFITGIGQVVVTTFFGYLIAHFLGFSWVSALYIAIALTFSSTIIVLKLLSDKKDTEKLYGRISIGFLLVQDVIATFIMIGVSSMSQGGGMLSLVLLTLGKGLGIGIILYFISNFVLPHLSKFFASSQEYLFLFSVGWGFGMAALFSTLGFSVEIGALIAGITLSVSPYASEISSKLKPLRDFFIIMFFIMLGSSMNVGNLGPLVVPSLLLSTYVLIGNPLIIMILIGLLGYKKKVGFMAGMAVAQISEFSMILIMLGVKVGHIDQTVLSLVTIVCLITIAISTYMFIYSEKLFALLEPWLGIFERARTKREVHEEHEYDVILFGCNRVGYDFVHVFKALDKRFLGVDYNPLLVNSLVEKGINCIYGDVEDIELLNELNLEKAKLIVSTIPDIEANLFLLYEVKKVNESATIILLAPDIKEALTLYDRGADYVILPHLLGGQLVSDLADKIGLDNTKMQKHKEKHIHYLKTRVGLDHI